MKITKRQIGFIKGLLKKHGGEVSSEELEGMTYHEADRMIKSLLGKKEKTPEEKMKNKIISMAMTIGWLTKDDKIDMGRLNGWCLNRGMYKKRLDDHNYTELVNLVTQFQGSTNNSSPLKHGLTKV